MSWFPVTFTTCRRQRRGWPGTQEAKGLQARLKTGPKQEWGPKVVNALKKRRYRLVGDDQLDDWEGIEDSDGGNIPAAKGGKKGGSRREEVFH